MCRFLLYLGPELPLEDLITRPSHSLVYQSHHAEQREEPLNGDGFGVAWYVPAVSPRPAAFRSITPAWSNRNLQELCRVASSGCVLAHVRAASPGLAVAEANCHPFVAGSLAFMHNGHLGGFPAHNKRALLEQLSQDAFLGIEGSTDSEHVFAVFQDVFARTPSEGPTRLADALQETLRALRPLFAEGVDTALNLAVTDGTHAVISRFGSPPERAPTLYLHEGKRYTCVDGRGCMEDPDGELGAVIVASEPISTDPGWDLVPANHLVLVEAGRTVEMRPLEV